ncbi:protein NDNF-like [Epargyreus clarus]|uniref:protein NDNF-like n=1 Tax=Epargyreus clarus TaxID=520877 RepID=UPI003C2DD0DB
MGNLIHLSRLAVLIILHAAGAGYAAPSVLVTRPVSRVTTEWLPMDNQTVYRLDKGESKNLELNTSSISQTMVYLTVSPCSRNIHWALYNGKAGTDDGQLNLLREYKGVEMVTLSINTSRQEKYILQLSTPKGGAIAVSVRGEATRLVRMRLRVRSRRRLSASWDPSPIDPQETNYCVVASHKKNYTSLCAAQYDVKASRLENKSNRFNSGEDRGEADRFKANGADNATRVTEVDNKIEIDTDSFSSYESFKNVYRRKKFGRSTRVTNEDPVIACVGERTHHLIENLDPSITYFVSVFGVARDRRAGSLLAIGNVKPRTSTAKRLRENVPHKSDIRGKSVYYFKATISSGGGLWLGISTCGGSVDVEVSVRGKRLYLLKDIEPHAKFFVPAPIPTSSIQETSDEGSVQFDSSSEETRMRYVIRVIPNRWYRDGAVNVEVTASTTRWGANTPELLEDGGTVRELRPRRSCKSVDVAFLPASHNATDVIRYCITTREIVNSDSYVCSSRRTHMRNQCMNHLQRPPTRVIVQKVLGLRAGKKYAIQVTASNKGVSVPYNMLYVDTNASCKEE